MLFDWFTVGAQVVNFLVLVLLLKKFLYGPVTKAMAEREARIAAAKAHADDKARQAEEEATKLQASQAELAGSRDRLLAAAHDDAETHKKQEVDQARQALQAQQARWQQAVAQEREGFLREVRTRVAEQACQVARRVLLDLADEALEERILGAFARRLTAVPAADRDALAEHVRAGGEITAATSFEASQDARRTVEDAVREALGPAQVRWVRSPELAAGVVLTAGGRRLAWSVSDHLDQVEQRVTEVLNTEGPHDGHDARSPAPA
jgi:F-type H+-transporting ATPase subunit b